MGETTPSVLDDDPSYGDSRDGKEAHALGASKHVLTRMAGNVAVDAFTGLVPVLGDAFDVFWRANRRNVRLLREHFEREGLI